MTQSLDDMLKDLPNKEDLDNAPRYCKWCGTWNPIIEQSKTTLSCFFCQYCGNNGKRTEFTRTEEALKSKQRLDAKRQGQKE